MKWRRFRKGDISALLVSDVAARGLDVPECDAVFNLELPSSAAAYAHRAGRTGRFGRYGLVVTCVEANEAFVVGKLAKELGINIIEAEVRVH
jgi:superfamily II DNA/RNA helicase